MWGREIEGGRRRVGFEGKDILEGYEGMVVMTELATGTRFC